MTIEQLGSVGEIVGALATVATLGYLAIQIRANTRMMRAQSRHVGHQLNASMSISIAENPQLAGVLRRGFDEFESLEPDEQVQFTLLMSQYLANAEHGFQDVTAGITSQPTFERAWLGIGYFIRSHGGRSVWAAQASQYPSEFRAFVDGELSRDGPREPPPGPAA